MLATEAWLHHITYPIVHVLGILARFDRITNSILHVFAHIHIILRPKTLVMLIVVAFDLLGHLRLLFVFVMVQLGCDIVVSLSNLEVALLSCAALLIRRTIVSFDHLFMPLRFLV